MKKMLKVMMALVAMVVLVLAGALGGKVLWGEDTLHVKVDSQDERNGGNVEEERTIECVSCNASGTCFHCEGEKFRDGRRCSVCDGSGDCNLCQGKGKRKVFVIDGKDYTYCAACKGKCECSLCDGEGYLVISLMGYNKVECNNCSGKGKCKYCSGTGYERLRGF